GYLRHGKISLGKLFSGRIDTDKDLGDRLNIEVFRQLDDADMVVDDLPKLFQYARDAFAVSVRIPLGVVIRELHQAGIRGEDICHILTPGSVPADRSAERRVGEELTW